MAKSFSEFLEQKKKKELIDVKDGLAGEDYDGPLATKPPQEPTKGKTDKPLPYRAAGEVEGGKAIVAYDGEPKKGLAHHATPGITPQTSPQGKPVEDVVKQSPKPKKLTSEEFVNRTKDMTDSEFLTYLAESHGDKTLTTITDLFGNEFTPDPTQSIQYVTGLMMGNQTYLTRFIRELKRRGGMEDFLSEMLDHNDTYDVFIDQLEDDEVGGDRCSRFAKTLNDRYMSVFDNFDFGDDMEDMGESVSPNLDVLFGEPSRGAKPQGGAFGGGSGPDGTPNPNYSDPSVYAKNPQANPMGAQSMRNPTGGGGNPTGGGVMGGQQNPQFAGGPPVMPPKRMKEGGGVKYRGNSAALSLINELSGYPAFKSHMKERCRDC